MTNHDKNLSIQVVISSSYNHMPIISNKQQPLRSSRK
uniref:Uncharacterized protein n=1 Tax=Rhizophora mucronata TaxID=61149 RepID=A0A2P2NB03_RHIMU